MTNKVIVS